MYVCEEPVKENVVYAAASKVATQGSGLDSACVDEGVLVRLGVGVGVADVACEEKDVGGDASGRLLEQKNASQEGTDGTPIKSWQDAAEASHQQAKPLGYAEKHANFVAAASQLFPAAASMAAAVPCGLEQVPAPPKPHVNGKGPS